MTNRETGDVDGCEYNDLECCQEDPCIGPQDVGEHTCAYDVGQCSACCMQEALGRKRRDRLAGEVGEQKSEDGGVAVPPAGWELDFEPRPVPTGIDVSVRENLLRIERYKDEVRRLRRERDAAVEQYRSTWASLRVVTDDAKERLDKL
jgi:hypothetical protein